MPYTAQFFEEKLNVPVEYFNPFRNVELDPSIDLDELSKHAHSFGEVVGLGLRELAHCPVELNLMPRTSLKRQEMVRKRPYFIAAGLGLILIVAFIGYAENGIAAAHRGAVDKLKQLAGPLEKNDKDYTKALAERDNLQKQLAFLSGQVENRYYWAELITGIKTALVQAEAKTREKARAETNNDVNVWIEAFCPKFPSATGYTIVGQSLTGIGEAASGSAAMLADPNSATNSTAIPATNEIGLINIRFRAIDRDAIVPNANNILAYALQDELTNTGYFVAPRFIGAMIKNDQNGTFTFDMVLPLKRPHKF